MNPRCANSYRCLCRCECSQLEPLCIHSIYPQIYKYSYYRYFCVWTSCCANSHMSVPLRVLTVRTSLHTYICSQVYIYSITNTFVYRTRAVQSHTMYVHPCGCSHLESIHILYTWHSFVYVYPMSCELTSCLMPLRVLIVRTSLYTCKYSDLYTYSISQILLYVNSHC